MLFLMQNTKLLTFFSAKFLAEGQLDVHQDPCVFFYRVVFYSVGPQPQLGQGVITSQGQDFTPAFVELHVIPVSQFLQPVEVTLDDSKTFWCISHFLEFCVICRLAEGTLYPSTEVINEDAKQSRPLHWPLGLTTGDWPLVVLHAASCNSLSLAVQSVFCSLSTSLACTLSLLHHVIYSSAL